MGADLGREHRPSAEPQSRGQFEMGRKGHGRDRFLHVSKATVSAVGHFIIVSLKAGWSGAGSSRGPERFTLHPDSSMLWIQTSLYDWDVVNQILKYLRENRMKSCHCKHLQSWKVGVCAPTHFPNETK